MKKRRNYNKNKNVCLALTMFQEHFIKWLHLHSLNFHKFSSCFALKIIKVNELKQLEQDPELRNGRANIQDFLIPEPVLLKGKNQK